MTLPYVVTDQGTGLTATAYVTIVVPPPSSLPAKDDFYTGPYNAPLVITLPNTPLANDGPSPGDPTRDLNMTTILVDIPTADGNLTQVNLATGEFVFVPQRGFYGNTTFTYGAAGNEDRGNRACGVLTNRWHPPGCRDRSLACLPACLPTCLPACLPTVLYAYPHALPPPPPPHTALQA